MFVHDCCRHWVKAWYGTMPACHVFSHEPTQSVSPAAHPWVQSSSEMHVSVQAVSSEQQFAMTHGTQSAAPVMTWESARPQLEASPVVPAPESTAVPEGGVELPPEGATAHPASQSP